MAKITSHALDRDPISLIGNLRLQRVYEEAGDKTRTCDRLITNQLLYQLSYTSFFCRQPYIIGQSESRSTHDWGQVRIHPRDPAPIDSIWPAALGMGFQQRRQLVTHEDPRFVGGHVFLGFEIQWGIKICGL